MLKWLSAEQPAPAQGAVVQLPPPRTVVDRKRRCLIVTLQNPTKAPLPVEVVSRVMTWEPALVGDQRRLASLAPAATAEIEIPLPTPGPTSYQAIADRDAYRVRLGVLSGDGRTLLCQTRVDVDLRPVVRLKLATQEVRSFKPSYVAPPPGMPNRLGLPVMTYAAGPGQEVEALATIDNGLSNLAPLAQVRDESDPANRTLKALTDGASLAERGPDWYALDAYGCYVGPKGKNVVLSFTFPEPVWLAAVSVLAAGDTYRNHHRHNPATVAVEIDGREVAHEEQAGPRLLGNYGLMRLAFSPVRARQLRLRMNAERGRSNDPIWLGELSLEGSLTLPPHAVQGTLTVARQGTFAGPTVPLLSRAIRVGPLERIEVPVKVSLPEAKRPGFYRLTASLNLGEGTRQAEIPLLAISPQHPLLPMSQLQSGDFPSLGFIVTRGFRNALETGTGTAEDLGGWGQPDDLVWAYERGLKQLGAGVRTQASRLFVSENDMRHYCSPWKPFYNGEEFFDVATPGIVQRMQRDRRWAHSDQVNLGFSDRWDPGPQLSAMHSWQDFEGFNAWLLERGQPGLQGRTRKELAAEINLRYEGLWNAWHLERFLHSLAGLREGFARLGKRLVLTAQGIPMIPGKEAEEVGRVERGMSDDSTWGQIKESVSLTTARQMAALAFTPSLALSTLLHWGYNSAALNNCQWRGAIGTTEPSRRHLYDRAFRGTLRPNGSYSSMHVYGYNSNAGEGFTLASEDLDARQRVQDLHSLLTPDGPIGAGIVLSTAPRAVPSQVRFDCGDALALPEARDLALAASRLHDAGVSIPFSANAACLEKWRGTAPLILTNLPGFSEAEVATLRSLAARGIRLAALVEGEKLSPAAAALFGVTPEGARAKARRWVKSPAGRSLPTGRACWCPWPRGE